MKRRGLALAALVAYGWWATSLQPFSAAAAFAVVGAGVVAVVWGAMHRHRRRDAIERRGLAMWLPLTLALAAWQLAAFVQEPRSQHPTLSSMANVVLEPHFVRALACAAWLLVAVKLAER